MTDLRSRATQNSENVSVTVEVVSDVICPWFVVVIFFSVVNLKPHSCFNDMVCELMAQAYIDPVIKLWRDHVPVRHRCYIGKRRLDSAIEQLHGEDGFDVNVKWYTWIFSPKEIHRGRVVDKRTSYIK